MSEPQEKQTTQEQAARRIAHLLALADDAAKQGNETLRDTYIAKATGLQHKYAVDQIMLEAQGEKAEEIIFGDFCDEQNTPLIKAKRQLVVNLSFLYRGHTIMCGRWNREKGKYDKRAYLRVHAYESDLRWITQLYTSLILQLQTEMAKDERVHFTKGAKGVASWRVSYAHEWVRTVFLRLSALQRQNKRETEPGTALVLVEKGDKVRKYVEDSHALTKARRTPISDKSAAGRTAGREAAYRADLGQSRVAKPTQTALD
jgi:RNase P subunit RPR2